MTYATFFLSTGRCGTQWVVKQLSKIYADQAVVTHEPLQQLGYWPRELFAHKDPTRLKAADQIFAHVDKIERQLTRGHYIECGWMCYAIIPYFAERFAGRVRIVHLVRHPVPTASSMVTHRFFSDPPRKDRLTELSILSPFDQGIRFPEYRDRWPWLNEYEKCLYFWAEIQAYALGLESELRVPWLRLKSEELFTPPGIDRLLDFLELPRCQTIYQALGQRVDSHQFKSVLAWDFTSIADHPEVMALARTLGYDPLYGDDEALHKRYQLEGTDLKLTDPLGPTLVNRED